MTILMVASLGVPAGGSRAFAFAGIDAMRPMVTLEGGHAANPAPGDTTAHRPDLTSGAFLLFEHDPDPATLDHLSTVANHVVYMPHIRVASLHPPLVASLAELEALPGVLRVDGRYLPRLFSDVATPNVKARESDLYSPETAWELGYTGKGSNVAIMDTGIDGAHPALAGKFLGGVDTSKPETFLTPRDGSFDPDDTNGHGTTCAGIATGTGAPEGKYMGAAPDAKLVDIRIGTMAGFAPGEAIQIPPNYYDASLQGIEWAISHADDNWPQGGPEFAGIDIVSLSWGINVRESSDGSDVYSRALDRAVDAGIVCVVAAGNNGPDNDGFDGMGSASKVITVAASDDLDTIDRADDVIAEYSSRGPRADNEDGYPYDELKPDVTAPGTHINQANFDRAGDGSGGDYGSRGSGTSYATPVVAGVVAMMLEANPDLTPPVVKEILRATSERRGQASFPALDPFWNKDWGWGLVDAYEATKMAAATDPGTINVELQSFITNITVDGGTLEVSGVSWARQGGVEDIQVRVDGGRWISVGGIEEGYFANWTAKLPLAGLDRGVHTVETRAVSGDRQSLEMGSEFELSQSIPGPEEVSYLGALLALAFIGGVAALWYVRKKRRRDNEEF